MIHFDDVDDPDILRSLSLIAVECIAQSLRVEPVGAFGTDPLDQHARLFPPWALLNHPERCARVFAELPLLLGDGFVHRLSGLHACVLYEMIDECAFFAAEDVRQAQVGEVSTEDGDIARARLDRVMRLRRHPFGPAGISDLEGEVAALLIGPPRSPARIAQVMADYGDCIPGDIRAEIEARHRP